jgi:hypothetical protein
MAKPQPKPAKSESETQGPPDLALVDKAPPQPKASEAAKPRTAASQTSRRLHPSRVWPD